MTCPNKSSNEWKSLKASLNDNDLLAYKVYYKNGGVIPTPEEGKKLLENHPELSEQFILVNKVLSDIDKVNLIEGVTSTFLVNLIEKGLDKIFTKSLSSPELFEYYLDILDTVADDLEAAGNPELAALVTNDPDYGNAIFKELKLALEPYQIILDELDNNEKGMVEGDSSSRGLDVKNGLEFDTKTGYGRSTKLLLAAIGEYYYKPDGTIGVERNALGLRKNGSLARLNNKLGRLLGNGVPDTTEVMKDLLKYSKDDAKLAKLYQFLGNQTTYTGGDNNIKALRKQFAKDMTKNIYSLTTVVHTNDGEILVVDANKETVTSQILANWKANFQSYLSDNNIGTLDELKLKLHAKDPAVLATRLGIVPKDSSLLRDSNKKVTYNNTEFTFRNLVIELASNIIAYGDETKTDNLSFDNEKFTLTDIYSKSRRTSGILMALSELAVENSDEQSDLQVRSGEGKMLNSLNLNTFQTTLKNQINRVINNSEPAKLEENLKKQVPFLFNNDSNNSLFLSNILNGNPLNLGLINSVKNQFEDGSDLASLPEAGLYSTIFAHLAENKFPALKHADRNQYYYYQFGDGKYDPTGIDGELNGDWDRWKSKFKQILYGYLTDELNRIVIVTNNINNINVVNYVEKQGKTFQLFTDILSKEVQNNLITEALSNFENSKSGMSDNPAAKAIAQYNSTIDKNFNSWMESYFKRAVGDVESYKLLYNFTGTNKKPMLGLGNKQWLKFNSLLNPSNKTDVIDVNREIVKIFAAKWFISGVEQSKIFFGDPMFYEVKEKNGNRVFDLAKRLNMQSSSKENCLVDVEINTDISKMHENPDSFFYDSTTKTKKPYVKAGLSRGQFDGQITEFVVDDVQFTSSITNELKDLAEKDPQKWGAIYKQYKEGINGADGFSWTNIFFAREFAYRSGQSNFEGLNNTFEQEMIVYNEGLKNAILNEKLRIPDGYNLIPFEPLKDDKGNIIYETKKKKDGTEEKVPVLTSIKTAKEDLLHYLYEYRSPFVITKPQYTGVQYLTNKDQYKETNPKDRLFVPALRKTSYMPLIPSVVEGTNLEKMMRFMVEKGIDVVHFKSAAKVGSKKIRPVYGEDNFLNTADLSSDEIGYLDFLYMGKQVEIAPKPKSENTVSTQERKNKTGNGYNSGEPVSTELKELLDTYQNLQNELTKNLLTNLKVNGFKIKPSDIANADSLVDRDSVYDVYKIKSTAAYDFIKVVKNEAIRRGDASNIIEAIENWAGNDKTLKWIETLPNYKKVQDILAAMINNPILGEKRFGTSQPQASSVGFEKLGTALTKNENGYVTDDTLKFYSFEYDDKGNITKINPAEIMMTLPYEWIPGLMAQYQDDPRRLTNNVYELVNLINEDLEKGLIFQELQVKGLRIPHQQLSSSDCFKIKKFLMPGLEQAVVIPKEMVTKTGGDFDIDKMNLYFPHYKFIKDSNKLEYVHRGLGGSNKEAILQNEILEVENKAFLHPSRPDSVIAPVDDSVLKKLVTPPTVLPNYTNQFEINMFVKQVMDFVGGKDGLGIVATWITFHNLNQRLGIKLNDGTSNLPSDLFPNYKPTNKLGLLYSSNIDEAKKEKIEDVLSSVLTAMVDIVKDAYATDLNLIKQTLNTACYLVCRGVPLSDVINFLKNPELVKFLNIERNNKAPIIEYTGVYKEGKNEQGLKYTKTKLIEMNSSQPVMDFQFINGQADIMTILKDYIKVDTERLRSPDEARLKLLKYIEVINSNLIDKEQLSKYENETYLKEFFNVRRDIRDLFTPLYLTKSNKKLHNDYSIITDFLVKGESNSEKENQKAKMEQAFVNYLLQTRNDKFKGTFERLFIGKNSLGKRLSKLKKEGVLSNNPLIKELITLANNDNINDEFIDNIRLFSNKLNTFENNRYLTFFEELRSISPELADDLVIFNILQSGLSTSYLQYSKILSYKAQKQLFDVLGSIKPDEVTKDDLIKFFVWYTVSNKNIVPTEDNRYKRDLKVENNIVAKFPYFKFYDNKKAIIKNIITGTTENFIGSSNFAAVELLGDISKYEELANYYNNILRNKVSILDIKEAQDVENVISVKPNTTTSTESETKINIYAGTGENADLSNFAVRPFEIDGYTFNTVEGYFQARKLDFSTEPFNADLLTKFQNASGAQAKSMGKAVKGLKVEEWNNKASEIMKEGLLESFKQNPDALAKLLATGNAILTHTQDKGKWSTEFPKLLMEVRNELRNTQQPTTISQDDINNLPENKC